MIAITETIERQGKKVACGNWLEIQEEAAKHHRAKVEVTKYSEAAEISDKQRKWLHCDAGPIKELMRGGWSFRDAKEFIKLEYGREWFVVELTDDNFNKVEGIFRWECNRATCKKLFHALDILGCRDDSGQYCPNCSVYDSLRPIAIKSIMNVSVKKTNLWFAEIFEHFPKNEDGSPRIQEPDPEWSKKLSKK